MEATLAILVCIILLALIFDFTNGFHDAANSVAPTVATRALPASTAIALAAAANFVGAFFAQEVASTMGTGIVDPSGVTLTVVLAALCGAISWNLITWYFAMPASSSLALVGGIVGAGIAHAGPGAVLWNGVAFKVTVPTLLAPVLGGVIAIAIFAAIVRLPLGSSAKHAHHRLRRSQIVAGAWLAFSHGASDAQKTLGLVGVALLAYSGAPASEFGVPPWAIIAAATTMALGTWFGGARIIRTMATKITRLDPAQGTAASVGAAVTLMLSARYGLPVSTTYVGVGSILGAGAARHPSRVRWTILNPISLAWITTLPMAALVGGIAYGIAMVHPVLALAGVGALAVMCWVKVQAEAPAPAYASARTPDLAYARV